MQQLHLVGFTADNEGLIFSTRKGSKSGSYVLTLDKRTLNRLDEARRRRDGGPSGDERGSRGERPERPESLLSPREIQARLRSGRTIAQVAREAGVTEEWVARFAAPIQAEQAQVIDRARNLVFSKARLGASAQPLGDSVRWNLFDRGTLMTDEVFNGSWSAFHLREHVWVVRFGHMYRKKLQTAEWEVDLRENLLTARNRHATELGYLEPGRRRRKLPKAVMPEVLTAAKAPARPAAGASTPVARASKATRKSTRAGKKSSTRRPAAKKTTAKKTTAKKATAKRPSARKATAKKSAARRPTAKKSAAKQSVVKKSAPTKSPARRPAAKKAAAAATPRTSRRPAGPATRRPATSSPTPRPVIAKAAAPAQATPVARPVPAVRPIAAPAAAARPSTGLSPAHARPRPIAPARVVDEHDAFDDEVVFEPIGAASQPERDHGGEPDPIRIVSNVPARPEMGEPSSLTIRADRAEEATRSSERGRLFGRRQRPLRAR